MAIAYPLKWSTDDDMGHGFFVPVIAAYIAWQRREELLAITPKPDWRGLILVILARCRWCWRYWERNYLLRARRW